MLGLVVVSLGRPLCKPAQLSGDQCQWSVDAVQGARKTAGHARHSGTVVAQQSAAALSACPGSSLLGTGKSKWVKICVRPIGRGTSCATPESCEGARHPRAKHQQYFIGTVSWKGGGSTGVSVRPIANLSYRGD
ncbi:hypothetical protein NA56DRAFT_333056 [Hyaloscypha hepaticicola]|uniref:Uncharacterized protein n=1 Tax=Hyaloscypha hepaticicola TaxID=2082293 RepID=A0A2J6PNL8_9HELO|nr:hypothetical protein NA56DRAFT_333056 [Hyaloscypha hepaticicola]